MGAAGPFSLRGAREGLGRRVLAPCEIRAGRDDGAGDADEEEQIDPERLRSLKSTCGCEDPEEEYTAQVEAATAGRGLRSIPMYGRQWPSQISCRHATELSRGR